MATRNSFSFFVSYIEAIEELPEKEQLAVLKAIIKYALYDEEPQGFKGIKQAVFLLVKPTLDKSKQKAANGKQKGSKRKQTESKRKQTESKPEANGKQDSILPSIGEGIGEGEGIGVGLGDGEGEESAHAEGSLFTDFWNAYPEHARGDREAAWEAWKKLSMTDDKAQQVLTYLDNWKASQRWTSDGGAFIPAAKNFLTPEKSYLRTKPAPAKQKEELPKGATGTLGEAELEAIRRVLDADEVMA